MIKDDQELAEVTKDIGLKLQEVTDYIGDRNHESARIRFPRGYLRTCVEHRRKYSFLDDHTLQSNIAYALMQTDLYRWMMNRTDISGQALEMLIKEEISLIGEIIESLTKKYLHGKRGGGQNYKYRSQVLVDENIISSALKDDIDWIWDKRNDSHLFLLKERVWQKYSMADCNRAIRTLHSLRDSLAKNKEEGAPDIS
ncbi:hypothetical protein ACMXYX_04910 [Neptuniibacter sp. QD72_48]|uniref:hypothetical protein n=1 Tax=Neptuniibacter sp. QD72_48 TaxID=3398214 RepID=UPI0039F52B3E